MNRLPEGFDAVLDAAAPLAEAFRAAGHRMYLVGGVVRDHCLGIERHDNDLDATTDARPERIKTLVAGLADAVWTQGERFGTIGCTIDGRTYEITTHRTEVYAHDSRKPEVAFGDRIDDDLARRDFTVNAMAVDLIDHAFVDPFDGRSDLERRILRTPLEPEVAFSEDPLRMLRAARFHAGYALDPTPELTAAVESMGDRMEIVSTERVREELDKLLGLEDPEPGLSFLASTGLMRWVVPELAGLNDAELVRVARRVRAVDITSPARWGALLLDVDDPAVRLGELKSSSAHIVAVRELIGAASWLDDDIPTATPAIRRAMTTTRSMRVEEVIGFLTAVRSADGLDTVALDDLATDVAELRRTEPDLDGGGPAPVLSGTEVIGLLGLTEGPDVGRAMDYLLELRLDEGPLDPDEARTRLEAWWAAGGRLGD